MNLLFLTSVPARHRRRRMLPLPMVLAALVACAAPTWAAPVAPSGTGDLEEEAPAAVSGRVLQRPSSKEVASGSRTVDILIEMQDKSAGLDFNASATGTVSEGQAAGGGAGRRAAGALAPAPVPGLAPGLIPAAPAPVVPAAVTTSATPQGGLFGSGAVPMVATTQPAGVSPPPAADAGSVGRESTPVGAYRGNPGFRSMEGPGERGLLQKLLGWIRDNRAMVAGGALLMLALVWGTSVAVARQQSQ
jgi:hypothetical protein